MVEKKASKIAYQLQRNEMKGMPARAHLLQQREVKRMLVHLLRETDVKRLLVLLLRVSEVNRVLIASTSTAAK